MALASSEASDGGRFTRQFCRCTSEISAAVDCAFVRGAMSNQVSGWVVGAWGISRASWQESQV